MTKSWYKKMHDEVMNDPELKARYDEYVAELIDEEKMITKSYYQDDFGHMIKEGDILAFTLCGRRFTGEVLKIFSPEAAKSSWQVWTYESPKLKLSLLHMCEDVACSKVRVIGHISTVRQGGVAVQDIGIQI